MGNSADKQKKYITLKEASKMTGYSPDYLGQLIRKGKLDGKQVYLNVAWMTTEEAVKEYLAQGKVAGGAKAAASHRFKGTMRRLAVHYSSGEQVIRLARRVIYLFIAVTAAICLFLAYALIANILRASGT